MYESNQSTVQGVDNRTAMGNQQQPPRPLIQCYSELSIAISELRQSFFLLEDRLQPLRAVIPATDGRPMATEVRATHGEFSGNLIREIDEIRQLRGNVECLLNELDI